MNIEALKLAIARFAKHDLSAYTTAEKRDVLATITGYLVGVHTPLPNTPVSELVNYYITTHEPVTMKIFDQVNDEHFINTRLAADVTRNVYLLRYNMVYNPDTMLKLTPYLFNGKAGALPQAVDALFAKIPPETLAKVNEYYF